jgi:hypothetical protein
VVPLQFAIAAAWILAANLAADWAFPRLFGAEWANAIPYLRALSVAYLVQIVLHPVSGTLQLLERQATAAIWQICRLPSHGHRGRGADILAGGQFSIANALDQRPNRGIMLPHIAWPDGQCD